MREREVDGKRSTDREREREKRVGKEERSLLGCPSAVSQNNTQDPLVCIMSVSVLYHS